MTRAAQDESTTDDADRAAHALRRYFRGVGTAPAYSGADFATFGDNPENRVVADDLIAVAMLNGKVRQYAPRRLLETDSEAITALLTEIPAHIDLHAAAESDCISRSSEAWQLWRILRRGGKGWGLGEVATSKLLARKRPRLLPIWDDTVKHQWCLQNSNEHWQVSWEHLRHPGAVEFLRTARRAADVSDDVSTLRALDVLLWMSTPTRELPPVDGP